MSETAALTGATLILTAILIAAAALAIRTTGHKATTRSLASLLAGTAIGALIVLIVLIVRTLTH